jgi:predicted RNA-binding protein YlxR (DUF448 family)
VGVDSLEAGISVIATSPRPSAGSPSPTRTCVGCRRRSNKAELLRIVGNGAQIAPDPRAVLPGRGAYLHRQIDCLDTAERRRAIPRALRLPGPLNVELVRAFLVQEYVDSTHLGAPRMSTR